SPYSRSRADAHDLGWHADGSAGENAGQRLMSISPGIGGRRHQYGARPIDNGRGIAAGLDTAKGRTQLGEHLIGRRPDVAIAVDTLDAARQLEGALLDPFRLEDFRGHRDDFLGEDPRIARGDGAIETALEIGRASGR